jgi:hypothetical protein
VDLPEPEGPMMAIHWPGSTSSEKLSNARMLPFPLAPALAGYRRLTFFSLINLLSPQNHSGLDPPQQRDRQDGREQAYRRAPH